MRLFLVNATSDKTIRRIISRFLCMGVVGSKLAPPLIQKKTAIKLFLFGQRIKWSDPRINFVFVLHKRLFVLVHVICLCAVPELNFVRWHKRRS